MILQGFPIHGGIAQLGERLNGIQEVSGSIPLISTKTTDREAIALRFRYICVRMHPLTSKKQARQYASLLFYSPLSVPFANLKGI